MKNNLLYYSVGTLLYCPANKRSIVHSIINNKFGKLFSLALCLEDTINDKFIHEAEEIMVQSLIAIMEAKETTEFYLPKIFIRVRSPQHLLYISSRIKSVSEIVSGFILPKFSLSNADDYINAICTINSASKKPFYVMPIYESSSIIDLRTRHEILYDLKNKLSAIESLVLNIRVGGNDLCNVFGIRRSSTESIHKITPIASLFSDIITVYGLDYIVSGPVWEYFNGAEWKDGLIREISDDKLCGFIGKTVIHPNQISVVNNEFAVDINDYQSAKSILQWDDSSPAFVSSDSNKERMNELKTHINWAEKIMFLYEHYGIKQQ